MKFDEGDIINLVVGLVVSFLLFIVLTGIISVWIGSKEGYKQGQIDALNGSIHWQLQKQVDGQMLWTECENICADSAEGR